jgi:hypothetical protein
MMRRAAIALMLCCAGPALSGPVEVYRSDEQSCPRNRPATAARITAAEAVERARSLLPRGFCGPTFFVSGCDFDPEWSLDSWRVYALQYKLVNGRKDASGLEHSYVILDPVGNCIANIPGT